PLRLLDPQLPAALRARGSGCRSRQGRADPRGAAARDGGQPPGGQPRRLSGPRSLQPARRLRGGRLHLDALEGHLARSPVLRVRDRVDFDPFPYQSMAVWILTQMKRWGYIKTDVNYKKVAEEVFLATACREAMRGLGYKSPEANSVKHTFVLGKTKVFDPDKP